MRRRLAPWFFAVLALGCAEPAAPPPDGALTDRGDPAGIRPPALRWVGGPPALTMRVEVESDSGPGDLNLAARAVPLPQPLETYWAGTWLANWRSAVLRLDYADEGGAGADQGEARSGRSSRPFLKLVVPRGALYRRPDGQPIKPWEWVWVTVRVDSEEVLVHFGPSGLQFTPACPVLLQIWYDRLGLADSTARGLKLWHREPGGDWVPLPAEHSAAEGWFKAKICGFSSYQISY